MRILTENQVKVLELYSKGKQRSEICKILSLGKSSVDEAIRRGLDNVSAAIDVLEFALENGILDEQKRHRLKLMLASLKFSGAQGTLGEAESDAAVRIDKRRNSYKKEAARTPSRKSKLVASGKAD